MENVSLVIPVLNEEHCVVDTINSLYGQTRRPDEIIFVDGGSTDNTLEKINSVKNKEIPIKIISNKEKWQGVGRNKGVVAATYDIILCLDCGNIPDKNWIKELVEPLENDNELDLVAGSVLPMPENVFEKCIAGVIFPYLFQSGLYINPNNPVIKPSGSSLAFRKRIWEKVKGYPEWLATGEDKLFGIKLNKCGLNMRFNKNAVIYHHMRHNLRAFFKQCYKYGVGNGISKQTSVGLFNCFVKYAFGTILLATDLLSPINYIILVLGFSYYIYKEGYRPYLDVYKRIEYKQTVVFIPLILITRDIASFLGHFVGYLKWYANSYYKLCLKNYLEC